jgi:hypothetical protein
MCFSAGASFVAGTVLCATGLVTIKKAKTKSFLFLASIPLLFSIQQFIEGFVWLSLTNTNFTGAHGVFVYIFLFFALVVWPTLLPLSIYLIEENKKRKKVLLLILFIGIGLSVFMLGCLLFRTVSAKIMFMHIYYDIDYSLELPVFKNLIYIIPTVLPPFISSIKNMKIFGSAIVLSFMVTSLLFEENTVSVWCFFAAIISIIILLIVWKRKITPQENIPVSAN